MPVMFPVKHDVTDRDAWDQCVLEQIKDEVWKVASGGQ